MYPAETRELSLLGDAPRPGQSWPRGAASPWSFGFSLHQFCSMTLWWVLRVLWCQPLFRARLARPTRGMEIVRGVPFVAPGLRVDAADGLKFHARSRLEGGPGAHVAFGPGCSIGFLVRLDAGSSLVLGARVRVADRAVIGEALGKRPARATVLGDDVWVGTAAVITNGVTVGARAVVAAGAVVLDDVPPDTVVAGNPARVVKTLEPRSEP